MRVSTEAGGAEVLSAEWSADEARREADGDLRAERDGDSASRFRFLVCAETSSQCALPLAGDTMEDAADAVESDGECGWVAG